MYRCFIFDVDGTIIDTEEAILKSLQKALREEGREHTVEELRKILGIPGIEGLRLLNVANMDRVYERWVAGIGEYAGSVSVFPGMEKVLRSLHEKNMPLGIVTSKTRQEFADGFEPFGLGKYFRSVVTADDTKRHKPDPEPLLACLKELGAGREEAIYIGDTRYDLECAKGAGVKFGLALWGAKSAEGLDADHIFSEPEEILNLCK